MAGLYIHIPFCHSKCIYCDFFSTPRLDSMDALLDAVADEYARRRDEIAETFVTAYIGGGTPSIVPPSGLARLCKALPLTDVEEFTIEVNPEDVTPDRVAAWRDMGINRVSMGIQTFDDDLLALLRRRHSAADAERAIKTILREGISNISCDLIYGLPGQDIDGWEHTLNRLLDYGLSHLSAYCLSYEPGTALYARMTAGKITPTDDSLLADMYDLLCTETAAAGYEHYEISNFARTGMRSRHNSSYWTDTPYLGLGPGAHSFDGRLRRFNSNDLKSYVAGGDITEIDDETEDQRFNDRLITALRTADGLRLDSLTANSRDYLLHAAQPFIDDGSIVETAGSLRITEAAWFRSDAILRELIVV